MTVNAIAPGPIATDMAASFPELVPSAVPVGRFGSPEKIVAAALLIVRNAYLTGQTLHVNGGGYLSRADGCREPCEAPLPRAFLAAIPPAAFPSCLEESGPDHGTLKYKT